MVNYRRLRILKEDPGKVFKNNQKIIKFAYCGADYGTMTPIVLNFFFLNHLLEIIEFSGKKRKNKDSMNCGHLYITTTVRFRVSVWGEK